MKSDKPMRIRYPSYRIWRGDTEWEQRYKKEHSVMELKNLSHQMNEDAKRLHEEMTQYRRYNQRKDTSRAEYKRYEAQLKKREAELGNIVVGRYTKQHY